VASQVSGDGFNPSGALLKAMLINSGVTLTGGVVSGSSQTPIGGNPYYQGFGRIQLDRVLRFSDSTFNLFVVNSTTISTDGVHTYCFQVNPAARDFKARQNALLHRTGRADRVGR
jgi:hypothetical protein